MITVPTAAFNLPKNVKTGEEQTPKKASTSASLSEKIGQRALPNDHSRLRDLVVPVLPHASIHAVADSRKGVLLMSSFEVNSPRLSRKEAARYLGLSVATLAADVVTRRHCIPFQKLGSRCLYIRRELDQWAARHAVNGPQSPEESQPGGTL